MTLRALLDRALDVDVSFVIERLLHSTIIFAGTIIGLTLLAGLALAVWVKWSNRGRGSGGRRGRRK